MFWAFKPSFDVNILAFLATFYKNEMKFHSIFLSHCSNQKLTQNKKFLEFRGWFVEQKAHA
jgi:hypothetical protein